ncbi:hypothetical protein Rhopal_005617-T1 [Rhodotorula paludigena]|uniref:SPRY-domain-containing protein n=1 Tax=Rhodotorula paludigena TaxID=86838 RepID=A0AAV5GJI6_9BASI|nr:hypothetical protein Rhopal_005617-T1 [Rhodotorula paludigena]
MSSANGDAPPWNRGRPSAAEPAILSGSNRLPVSPRRSSAPLLPPAASSTSGNAPRGIMTTYQRPFPVPPYLKHASLYADRFETTPVPIDPADSAVGLLDGLEARSAAREAGHGDPKGKGRASLNASLGVDHGGEGEGLPVAGSNHGAARDAPILLPTCWDESDRCALLELTSDGLGVSFAGSAKYGDRDAAAVRANRPVPPQAGVYYYEVTVLDKGVSGYIGIGLSDQNVKLSRLPGWEKKSYGFHADDGRAFCCQGNGEPFGPTFTSGDVVGCGIDWTDAGPPRGERERNGSEGKDAALKGGARVFFTKNGEFLGYAFCNLHGKLFPTVGLRTPNEAVRVNFGAEPFKFDIEGLVLERKRAVLARLATTDVSDASLVPSPTPSIPSLLPPSKQARLHETLQVLISSYLIHTGCAAAAAAFDEQIQEERLERSRNLGLTSGRGLQAIPAQANGSKRASAPIAATGAIRARIRSAVLAGDARLALQLIEESYPAALDPGAPGTDAEDGDITFRLRCRIFIEAVLELSRASRDPAAISSASNPSPAVPPVNLDDLISLGQSLHAAYSADPRPAVRSELEAVLGLMAYADPEREATGRTRDLLDPSEREKLADEVNRAVLLASDLPPMPPLEALYRHAAATIQLAGDRGVGSAALVDVRQEVLGRQ